MEAPQEPPELEAVPVSAPNDTGTPVPAQRTAAAPVSALSDASTPAPAERTVQVQGKAPGPRVAQQKTLGPRAARPEVQGPRVARATVGTEAALGAAGITGSGAGVPGKPAGKGKTGKGG